MENIKEIESQIQIAEQTTQDAESALGNAQADAKSAEEIAERAQNEANDVSQVIDYLSRLIVYQNIICQKARDLKNETIETKKSAATMKVDATELDKAIDQATATLENYQKQAQTDKIRASDV